MDPIECLGTQLEHDGHNYELWLLRNEWHLYRGQPNGTDFYFFVIIRGEPKPGPAENEIHYRLSKALEDVNACAFFTQRSHAGITANIADVVVTRLTLDCEVVGNPQDRPQTDTPQITCLGRSIDLLLLVVKTPQLQPKRHSMKTTQQAVAIVTGASRGIGLPGLRHY